MGMGRYVIRVYSQGGKRLNSHHCDGSYDDLHNVATASISGIGDEAVGSLEIIDTENVDQDVAEMIKSPRDLSAVFADVKRLRDELNKHAVAGATLISSALRHLDNCADDVEQKLASNARRAEQKGKANG